MSQTKIEVINDAYSQMRISGLTVQPTPEDVEIALMRLENMMAEFESRNIGIGYNFEELPDPNSLTNVERSNWHMMATNLAIRLVPDFNKEIPQILSSQASQSLSNTSGRVAADNIRQVQYPRRQPQGSGNTLRYRPYYRYYREEELPPNEAATNKLVVGDINDYVEDYSAYLGNGETISSFVLDVDSGLNLESSSNTDTQVSYRVKALDQSEKGVFQQVKITVTTSTGRVTTRAVNFEIFEA